MKNFYSLMFLLGFYFISAQEYIPLANANHQWKVQFTVNFAAPGECPGLKVNHTYFFGEEVDMNGVMYLELYKRYEEGTLEKHQLIQAQCPNDGFPDDLGNMTVLEDILVGYLRDDLETKKVYFLRSGENEENELYNFSYPLGNTVLAGNYLISVSDTHAFNINTVQQEHSQQGNYYYHNFEGIGNIGDLIHHLYSGAAMEGGGYEVKGFSTDNGVTFYNRGNNILSNSEIETTNQVSIYPNPAKEFLNIKANKSVKSTSIYDLSGIKVHENNSTNHIGISHLKVGTYILHVIFEDGTTYKNKFLKK